MPDHALFAGNIRCRRQDGLLRATGIAYAQAGRWQRPQPVTVPQAGTDRAARACPQLPIPRLDAVLPSAFRGIDFDENCHELSVTAPENGRDLPVILWLHGGSYESGAADMGVFDPSVLVAEQRVVFVAVSYRLGLLGWPPGGGEVANLGALDVIAALRWVARHIAGFGGDPGRVTLFGQSSGGDLAARLMLAPAAQGLFHRTIIQSAPLHLPLNAGRMRRAMQRAAPDLDPSALIAAVLHQQQRMRRAARRFGLAGQMPFGVEFGADPFPPEADLPCAHAAMAPQIPIMIGHLRDEAALFLPPVAGRAGRAGRLAAPLRRAAVAGLTRRLYAGPARGFAARHRAAGGQAARFVIDCGTGEFGAAHLADLPLIFPGADWLGTPLVALGMTLTGLIRMGAPLRALWAGFAREGTVGADVPGLIRFHERA